MGRKNSFDFIRLFAAVIVVFSHSFALTGHEEPSIGIFSIGAIAVWIFFILSGYLISKSWDQYPRFNVFFAKRILRIFPGLVTATIFTVIISGLFFTSLPLIDFLFNQNTLNYFNNFFLYNTSFTLPGVFEQNIHAYNVNGSIWTLAYEFTMYVAVAVIGTFKIYKKISPIYIWLALFLLQIVMAIVGREHFMFNIFYMNISYLLNLALMFFSGVMLYKYESQIQFNTKWGLISLAIFVVGSLVLPPLTPFLAATFLTYSLFSLGRHPYFSGLSKIGDLSYGIYIYSFFIQQCLWHITQTGDALKMFAASLVISTLIAFASWFLVESKALGWKSKINPKKYPVLQTDEAW